MLNGRRLAGRYGEALASAMLEAYSNLDWKLGCADFSYSPLASGGRTSH